MEYEDLVYKVGETYWDVEQACYVETPTPRKYVVELAPYGEPPSEEYLIDTLKFYNFPLGKFAPVQTQNTLEERLAELEAELASVKEQLQKASSEQSTSNDGGLSYGV